MRLNIHVIILAVLAILTAGVLTGSSSNSFQVRQTTENKQVEKSSAKDKIQQAKKLIADAKKMLVREGKYQCCIEDPCNQCALDHLSCPCRSDLKKREPVCNECYAGWQRGEGIEEGIDPKSVKTSFTTHKH